MRDAALRTALYRWSELQQALSREDLILAMPPTCKISIQMPPFPDWGFHRSGADRIQGGHWILTNRGSVARGTDPFNKVEAQKTEVFYYMNFGTEGPPIWGDSHPSLRKTRTPQ